MILYKNFRYQELFDSVSGLLTGRISPEAEPELPDRLAGELVELAATYGFEGNLWHCFLAFCLANNENAYSRACEIVGPVAGTINQMALKDFGEIKGLFDIDIAKLDREGECLWAFLKKYEGTSDSSHVFNKRIRDRIVELAVALEMASTVKEFGQIVTEFYREFGVGRFGLNKAFRINETSGGTDIIPITSIEHVYLKDLVGYEIQKRKLIDNTEAFIQGRAANNVLLYGDAGTGKSSTVKAIANEFAPDGLRLIEVKKNQLYQIPALMDELAKNPLKFILFIDDLSFASNDDNFAALKAILEGGVGGRSHNVAVYATSNRRHLVKETMADRSGDDLHAMDTRQELMSLSARFGLTVTFQQPDKDRYDRILLELAKQYNVQMPSDQLFIKGAAFALRAGGRSPRVAKQFVELLAAGVKV